MYNKKQPLNIYLMGIGGTGMGAFAGLLKEKGHRVCGSDNAVYSPMREMLKSWDISYQTPYSRTNLDPRPDLVIVGNVIRKENEEARRMEEENIPFDSFPHALKELFLTNSIPMVVTGTHGKTTSAALMAHTLKEAGLNPGYLIGGIPLNMHQSFNCPLSDQAPFVIEGDEYDTAYFDKQPKFMHYAPKYLLSTSLEFDHGDIYQDVEAIIKAFAKLFALMDENGVIIINNAEENIKKALLLARPSAQVLSYGKEGDYQAQDILFDHHGISFVIYFKGQSLGSINIALFGHHNLQNALGVYAVLHSFGLTHEKIAYGFKSFLGVKRRLEEMGRTDKIVVVDDFAHHPTAVRETIKAARQKYPSHEIWAIFEPRSATSCSKVFENDYASAFLASDRVFLAPLGRKIDIDIALDIKKIASFLKEKGVSTKAYSDYESLFDDLRNSAVKRVFLFMSNGDLGGNKPKLPQFFT